MGQFISDTLSCGGITSAAGGEDSGPRVMWTVGQPGPAASVKGEEHVFSGPRELTEAMQEVRTWCGEAAEVGRKRSGLAAVTVPSGLRFSCSVRGPSAAPSVSCQPRALDSLLGKGPDQAGEGSAC